MRVKRIATHLPATTVAVSGLARIEDLDEQAAATLDRLGVHEVRDAGTATEVDLAHAAAVTACADAGVDPAGLDAVILVQGRAPQYLLSSEAARLQHAVGADRAFTVGVGDLGCVSSSAALTVARGLFAAHPGWRSALVAMGVRTAAPARYRAPMTVLGDGGQAAVLTPDDGPWRLVDQDLRVNGGYADLFRIRYRETGAPGWREECTDLPGYSFRLAVESRAQLTTMTRELLARNGCGSGDVAWLMQNLSAGAIAFWQRALGVELLGVCAANLRRYGHLGPADVLLNLDHAAPLLRSGDRVLVLNSSPVAAWSCALFEYAPDRTPERTPR